MAWVSIGGCATALMANTDIPTATAVPMINCVMLLFCMIASQCNRLQQTIAVACSKHVTNVTTRGRFYNFRSLTSGRALPSRTAAHLPSVSWSYQTAALSLRSDATDLSVDQIPVHPRASSRAFLPGDDFRHVLQNFMYL